MRILYVLTSLGVGGAEKQALALAERMARRGHSVAILGLMPMLQDEWPAAVPVVRLGVKKTLLSVIAGLGRASRFVRAFQPDLIHSHSFHSNLFARSLALLSPRLAVISTVHNVYEGPWPRMLAYRLTDGLSRSTVAVSHAAAERFVRLKAIPKNKIRVIANGFDTTEFAPSSERRGATRSTMAAASAFVWLAAGRPVPAKDFPNLLQAFCLVRAQFPGAQLWIAGAAEDRQTAADQITGGPNVRWLGLRRDMPALMDAADGFVSASAWEGMPLAVGEAMAMEKPVVATGVGGVRELAGNAGTIVPAKNPPALAEAMIAVMRQTPETRVHLGRAARQRVIEEFGIDRAADSWEALYSSIIDG